MEIASDQSGVPEGYFRVDGFEQAIEAKVGELRELLSMSLPDRAREVAQRCLDDNMMMLKMERGSNDRIMKAVREVSR